MKKEIIERLFEYKRGCTLVGFQGDRFVDVLNGPFNLILTSYYLCSNWKQVYIRLPNGAHYPDDYIKKAADERN
jgi:hypothetical protein